MLEAWPRASSRRAGPSNNTSNTNATLQEDLVATNTKIEQLRA